MKKIKVYLHKCMYDRDVTDMLFTPVRKNNKLIYHYWLCKKAPNGRV